MNCANICGNKTARDYDFEATGGGFASQRNRDSGPEKVSLQRLGFFEPAHAKNAETNDITLRVHPLHYRVMRGFFFITSRIGKTDFKEIRLRVEPDFYFFGHKSSPVFGLSVR